MYLPDVTQGQCGLSANAFAVFVYFVILQVHAALSNGQMRCRLFMRCLQTECFVHLQVSTAFQTDLFRPLN